jgi:hypothetical protein
MTYGICETEHYHHIGTYAGKFSDSKPADLLVQQLTKLESAQALSLATPLPLVG